MMMSLTLGVRHSKLQTAANECSFPKQTAFRRRLEFGVPDPVVTFFLPLASVDQP